MKKLTLSDIEAKILVEFLEDLSDRFGNDGCNDFMLPNTEEHVSFVNTVNKFCDIDDDPIEFDKKDKSIYTNNMMIVEWLIGRIKTELKEDKNVLR